MCHLFSQALSCRPGLASRLSMLPSIRTAHYSCRAVAQTALFFGPQSMGIRCESYIGQPMVTPSRRTFHTALKSQSIPSRSAGKAQSTPKYVDNISAGSLTPVLMFLARFGKVDGVCRLFTLMTPRRGAKKPKGYLVSTFCWRGVDIRQGWAL
jgi:hypothetical protein